MTNYVQRCLICPSAYAPLARALCNGLAPDGSGAGMLLTGLSPTGAEPATHYISEGMIEYAFAALLPLGDAPGQPDAITALAAGAATLAQVNALLAAIDVTEQDAGTAMARLGLTLVQVPL